MTEQGEMLRLAQRISNQYLGCMPVQVTRELVVMVAVLADRVGRLERDYIGKASAFDSMMMAIKSIADHSLDEDCDRPVVEALLDKVDEVRELRKRVTILEESQQCSDP